MKLNIAALFVAAPALFAGTGLETLVKIDTGWVSGSGTAVRTYKGILYAAPPVGDLRWKPPQPAKPWKGILLAKEYPNTCPQAVPMGGAPQKEDCLGLNVWTPAKSASDKLPVMVCGFTAEGSRWARVRKPSMMESHWPLRAWCW